MAVDGFNVLLVDDAVGAREVAADLLAVDGHQVETAASGREGLQLFRPDRSDLVITDRAMPPLSADRLASLIKREAPDTPITLLTGFGDMMLAQGVRPTGVNLVVAKPVTLAMLRHAIAQATGAPVPA